MENEIKLGKYRHFKGNEYEVIGIAKHGLWVRPASMWNENVERDGKIYQRFTYIGED